MTTTSTGTPHRPVVVFYTDNGMGLGHLTRQLAIAQRARGSYQPLFLTMSAAYTLPQSLGVPTEYFPSYGRLGITKAEWEPLVQDRFAEIIEQTAACAVVVDHVSPPRVFAGLRKTFPGTRFIWSRRGLWQKDTNRGALGLSDDFDLIVEPGDLAEIVDVGPTTEERERVIQTSPVVLVDRGDRIDRDEARTALGLPVEGRAFLVNVGDRDSAEVHRMIEHVAVMVRRWAGPDCHVFAPLHPLHGDNEQIPGVHMQPVYPVARYFSAFDGVVSSSGYNSFHEIVDSGLPAVFVPHRGARIDDQQRRARFGALCGRAHFADDVFGKEFSEAVRRMTRLFEASVAEEITTILGPMHGAEEFSNMLGELVRRPRAHDENAERLRPVRAPRSLGRDRLVTLLDHDEAQLDRVSQQVSDDEVGRSVFVIGQLPASTLLARAAVFETVVDETTWHSISPVRYADYVADRIKRIERRFGVAAPERATRSEATT